MPDVVCLGLLVADVIARPLGALPEPGTVGLLDEISLHGGGCALNTGTGLARLGLVRPVHAVAVALAGPDAGHVAVPVEGGALGHLHPHLPGAVREQAELDPLRVLREEREVRSLAVPARAKREGAARPDLRRHEAPPACARSRPRPRRRPGAAAAPGPRRRPPPPAAARAGGRAGGGRA